MLIGHYFKKINSRYKSHFFSGISFNSLTCKDKNIFFAIKGTEVDGNLFIKNAIKKGAKTVVSSKKFEGLKKSVLYIRSKNVRKIYNMEYDKLNSIYAKIR